ncbi:unnamed protein product, partial [Ectocarpus sp. 12 AP-2014]
MPEADPDTRAVIETQAARDGWPAVHAELARVDPESAARIHPNHSQRIGRALEVFRITGLSMTELHQQGLQGAYEGEVLAVALAPQERTVLHERIALRFSQMLDAGFVEEVRSLHGRGDLSSELPAIRAVGYRQLWDYLEDKHTLEEAEQLAIAATRQLAKRQFTWLRKWPELRWIKTDASGHVVESDLYESGTDI